MIRIVLTPGDPNGVGPEILAKIAKQGRIPKSLGLVCVGSMSALARFGLDTQVVTAEDPWAPIRARSKRRTRVRVIPSDSLGHPGSQCGWSIETAAKLLRAGQADALVTGPIHKARLQEGGYRFNGHTDFLASLFGVKNVTMMLANSQLRSSLVTTHLPLSQVPSMVNRQTIHVAVDHTVNALRSWWRISRPRIAVCSLNPHAGESGILGREEIEVISPALAELQTRYGKSVDLSGPFPSDTLYAKHLSLPKTKRYDAIVAMYHDQGLIPVKLLDFPNTVNVTLGLPVVRTSVDHGVAFDLAGKGLADPSSMLAAIRLAQQIVRHKPRTEGKK